MSQNDLVIANQSFPSFRTDLNSALQAINSSHSGSSIPSGAVAGTVWLDTSGTPTSNILKIYDGTDSISLAIINFTANTVDWLDSSISYNTTATSAGTLTLTVASSYKQFLTGTTTHTVVLPVTSTLTLGQTFEIHNNSTGSITVNSSGSNLVGTVQANTSAECTCILTSGTTAASWDFDITGFTSALPTTRGGTGLTAIGTSLQVLRVNSGATALEFATAGSATPFAVTGDATSGSEIRLPEDTDNGANYIALKAPDTIASNLTLTLPSADGTSGQVLQTNGSGVLSFSSVSSDFVLLATTDASSSASVSFDGYFSATYKNYMVIGSCIGAGTSSQGVNSRVRRSNADVTASNYRMVAVRAETSGSGATAGANDNWDTSSVDLVNNLSSSGSFCFTMTIFDPLNSSIYKWIKFSGIEDNVANGRFYITEHFQTLKDNTNAYSGISFFMDSGNIAYGNFKLYGIK